MIYSSCIVQIVARLCGLWSRDEAPSSIPGLISILQEFGRCGNEYARSCGEICKACNDTHLSSDLRTNGDSFLVLNERFQDNTPPGTPAADRRLETPVAVLDPSLGSMLPSRNDDSSSRPGLWKSSNDGDEDWDWATFCQSLGIVL